MINPQDTAFKSPANLKSAAVFSYGFSIAIYLIACVSSFLQARLIGAMRAGQEIPDSMIHANDTRESLVGLGEMIASLMVLIFFLMWIYRAHKNLGAFAIHQKKRSGLYVFSFFVPIWNWFSPYLFVREIWRGSQPGASPENWKTLSTPGWIKAWWAMTLVTNTSAVIPALGYRSEDSQILMYASWADIPVNLLFVLTASLAIKVILQISKDQLQKDLSSRPQTVFPYEYEQKNEKLSK